MPLRLRPALETDVPLLRSLAQRIWHACYADLLSLEQREYMLAWMYAPHKLASEIRRGVNYRIAEMDGTPVGYLAWETLEGGDTVHLHKLYLLPEWHGRGVGQAMLAAVADASATAGARLLELRVNRGNARALRAYARAGFEKAGEVLTDIGSGFVMDDFILRRPLNLRASDSDVRCGTGDPRSE
ncbi:MAG: hypothetical protein RIS76_1906 [Verrucomicrobiota bacterium]|jgi:GNAT superfamily N-acetyltransferase